VSLQSPTSNSRTQIRSRFHASGLFVFIFVAAAVIFLNISNFTAISKSFLPLAPHYGQALQYFLGQEQNRDASDRNWYAYYLIEQNYSGWTLLAFNREIAFFSDMYAFNFGGIKTGKVFSYDPDLTAAEANGLLSRRHWRGEIKRYGSLVIVLPESDLSPAHVIMVRHEKTIFMVPETYLPERMRVAE
jgi:hypothetical protein